MRLARLGSFHQTRLSFLRALLRTLGAGRWSFDRPVFDIDVRGVGVAVYRARGPERTYSLVCFSHDLPPEKRTDRVIAEEWDATFALFDGEPAAADIERLRQNVPRQEAGRCLETELVLARANRSVRLFDHVVESLAAGRQPDAAALAATGYLMRTTAVYGNGKFGIADRSRIADRPELGGPFRAEMLTVWLIRAFTVDLAEHLAALRSPQSAVRLDPALRRSLGVGNATGLGMAPFLVRHPSLLHRWILARETALARVRALDLASAAETAAFASALGKSHALVAGWRTDDLVQRPRIEALRRDLRAVEAHVAAGAWDRPQPWDALYRWGEAHLSREGQEYLVTLLIEPHGALVDDLADAMAIDETALHGIDGTVSPTGFARLIARHYAWAAAIDFAASDPQARFWYVSEEKLEPRLGERWREEGADREQPLATARDVMALAAALQGSPEPTLAAFLLAHPEHRHAARRVQIAAGHPYGEIRDNLVDAGMRPIDMLRCKLSFFGCTRFDPRSDLWLRITMFQGAPFPSDPAPWSDDWIYAGGGEA
ncbi:MAG: hypothetical protein NW223_21095 [Hyphomicrobiaceae bacterium]|nr:hypothetical protein [Hyphomicrobiaceae bacterium]